MSNISAVSSFFSSMNTSSSSSSGSGINSIFSSTGDLALIKNGTMKKLYSAYYQKNSSDTVSDEEAEEEKKAYAKVKSYADNLKSSASALTENSLYQKGSYTVTDSSGKETESEYDMDSIYKAVSAFVSDYNSLVSSAISEDTASTNRVALNLISYTSRNANLLSSIGITADSDSDTGKLTIDEDTFKSADINTIKSLFQGSGSYADVVSSKAGIIASTAANKAAYSSYSSSGSSTAFTYTASGTASSTLAASDITTSTFSTET